MSTDTTWNLDIEMAAFSNIKQFRCPAGEKHVWHLKSDGCEWKILLESGRMKLLHKGNGVMYRHGADWILCCVAEALYEIPGAQVLDFKTI